MLRLLVLLTFALSVSAQFQFFDQFFGNQQQQQHQSQEKQNVASDSNWYKQNWEQGKSPFFPTTKTPWESSRERKTNGTTATCSNYLCPDTLACVHFPHHCPCAHPEVEDKVELAEGVSVCASRGGWKDGETLRKIELARKGLL